MRLCALLLAVFSAAGPLLAAETALKSENDKVLYALGLWLGQKVSVFNLTPAEIKYVEMGLKDSATGKKPQVDLEAYQEKINTLAQARMAVKAGGQKNQDKAYLENAAKEKGARTFPSGLIYKEIKVGSGTSPKATDMVQCHYQGTLTNGTIFDSSYKRGSPTDFPLNGVIPCWTEGIQKMKVGGKSRLICPSSIAYGDQGHPPVIPGGAALIFDVELISIPKGGK
ncbi:MAG: peptidylprolyl isomerase [Elusimicrobia bacterium RIFCSPHIGHO2_02_FULL_57_9]|nr:MAG: peptidylprolyl isomerase [Elusimicrobia bacterium RIFCSPHIGHO2_02_FULL_57_9]